MTQKKPLNVLAIGVGALCVVLLIAMMAIYINYNSMLANKDGEISSLKDQLANAGSDTSNSDTEKTNLQNQMAELQQIVNLEKSKIWFANADLSINPNSYNGGSAGGETDYAGYLTFHIDSSSIDNAYVRVIYSSHGLNYDEQITVGNGGTAIFPIIPTQDVEFRIGNPNSVQATVEYTVTYYY